MGEDKTVTAHQTALWKVVLTIIAETLLFIFLIYTVFNFVKVMDIFLILITMFFVAFPLISEKYLSLQINGMLFVATLVYACGNIAGTIFCLFARTLWCDKLMHCFAGFLFASLGYYHLCFQKKCEMRMINKNIFAFSFSMMVSVLWEMVEFAVDNIFHLDMQFDMYVNEINTHLMSDSFRVVTHINNITETVVGDTVFQGYLDIGLFDTMYDLIMGGAGALVLVIFTCIDRDRHPLAVLKSKKA